MQEPGTPLIQTDCLLNTLSETLDIDPDALTTEIQLGQRMIDSDGLSDSKRGLALCQ